MAACTTKIKKNKFNGQKEKTNMLTPEILKSDAMKNHFTIYGDVDEFEDIWKQLKTPVEQNMYRLSCCYCRENGKIIVYFHVLDEVTDSFIDYDLSVWRRLSDKTKAKLWLYGYDGSMYNCKESNF